VRHLLLLVTPLLLVPVSGLAAETRWWIHKEYAHYERARLNKLSLSSDGTLTLAPVLRQLLDSPTTYFWSLAEDRLGNLYAGGGGPDGGGARVYMIAAKGETRLLVELKGLQVQALALDNQGRLYAATAPDGAVHRIAPEGRAELYYDPKTKYIWDMAFDRQDRLYLATGDRGEIHRVEPGGTGSVFCKLADTHARSLTLDPQGNLIVGTEPGGWVVRITPRGEAFVLYQSPRREITAVAVAPDGSIYAAGVGVKQPPAPPQPAAAPAPAPSPLPATLTPQQAAAPKPVPSPLPPLTAAPATITGGSEVYRIERDGFPLRVWSHPQDIAYTIAFDARGRPLIGTGNKGAIYRLDSDHRWTALVTTPPTQVTRLLAGRDGAIYAATGNIGQVYRLGPDLEREGSVESDVLDAGLFSYWGRLSFRGSPNGGEISISTRSGNLERPQEAWSPYSEPVRSSSGGPVVSPPARFLQWRAMLRAASDGRSPELRAVEVAWRQRNVPPRISQIEIAPANYRVPPPALSVAPAQTLTLPPLGQRPRGAAAAPAGDSASLTLNYAKGYRTVRWAASDENQDDLIFRVEIRGTAESAWKLLRDKVRDKHLSWDSTGFPDGEYQIRVIASDAPDNPVDQALSAELVSDPFLIDNTPPAIEALQAAPEGAGLRLRFRARDALSTVSQAECSVNGGEWLPLEPTDRLADSAVEDYDVRLLAPEGAELSIAVRVTDEYDNQSLAKTLVLRRASTANKP